MSRTVTDVWFSDSAAFSILHPVEAISYLLLCGTFGGVYEYTLPHIAQEYSNNQVFGCLWDTLLNFSAAASLPLNHVVGHLWFQLSNATQDM